jgi:hypothetical protein
MAHLRKIHQPVRPAAQELQEAAKQRGILLHDQVVKILKAETCFFRKPEPSQGVEKQVEKRLGASGRQTKTIA